MSDFQSFSVDQNEIGERLDLFLLKKYSDLSRNQIQKAIESGKVEINKSLAKSSCKLRSGDTVSFDKTFIDDLRQPFRLEAEKISLSVLFENDDVVVIDKPAGMVVHPAHGNLTGTLVNALLNYDPNIATAKNEELSQNVRPGIVHRLDKDTSGIILVAKNQRALSSLSKQLANKNISKTYTALVFGHTDEVGTVESFIGRDRHDRKKMAVVDENHGKLAKTEYKTTGRYVLNNSEISKIQLKIPTGRTHQIRVHMKSIGHPVIGDQTYDTKESKNVSDLLSAKRQMLHASKIEFSLPGENRKIIICSDLPNDFMTIVNRLS